MADAIKDRQRPDGYRDTLPGVIGLLRGKGWSNCFVSLVKSRKKKASHFCEAFNKR
jgi:hypothetical protein